ncbi:MAG: helix-turn-helix domain-containing protein [Oscillospiraceae bacterium]|nr:helix-turn-helix domain-containing protein [Oscillospiraceae bacterium]
MKTQFSELLSALRREKGLRQRTAASALGVSQALLSHYENGAREPKIEFIIKVCDYYGVSADYLLGRTIIKSGIVPPAMQHDGRILRLIEATGKAFEASAAYSDPAVTSATVAYLAIAADNAVELLSDPEAPADSQRDITQKFAEQLLLELARRDARAAKDTDKDATRQDS